MCELVHQRLRQWQLHALLIKYVGLRVEPTANDDLTLCGPLGFRLIGPNDEVIEDEYNLRIRVPAAFPAAIPEVSEVDDRIPPDFHKLEGNLLCLGAPTALRMRLTLSPSLMTLVEEFVVPYLAAYTHYVATKTMLFGELAHGEQGLREYLAELFHSKSSARSGEFVWLAARMKRSANKYACPCGSGRRLGKCHNRIVNALRRQLGRKWFAKEHRRLQSQLKTGRQPRRQPCFAEQRSNWLLLRPDLQRKKRECMQKTNRRQSGVNGHRPLRRPASR